MKFLAAEGRQNQNVVSWATPLSLCTIWGLALSLMAASSCAFVVPSPGASCCKTKTSSIRPLPRCESKSQRGDDYDNLHHRNQKVQPTLHDLQEDRPKTPSTNALSSSRRNLLLGSAATSVVAFLSLPSTANADSATDSLYRPAKRPTAYRVDSTIPPTLLPLSTAREQIKVLQQLAAGSGTDKNAVVVDTLNLNNMLNKAVFGTAQFIQAGLSPDDSKSGSGYASFVCLGVPKETLPNDVNLATSLLTTIVSARPKNIHNMAIGLHWAPTSTQPALDDYRQTRDYAALTKSMIQAGVDAATVELYQPLLQSFTTVDWLALSPELTDLKTALTQGLQQVDPQRRSQYVIDPQGFISLTQDPQFQLFTDRSLLKDVPVGVKEGDFFAQRILAHETAATVCAQYAASHSSSSDVEPLVAIVAPIPDVRFLVGGINGRLPRVSQALGMNKVTADAVTTILCNPTALETLSKSRYLRLEIGTGPDTLQYQAKVADYLWFSKMPKVNLIPRLMN